MTAKRAQTLFNRGWVLESGICIDMSRKELVHSTNERVPSLVKTKLQANLRSSDSRNPAPMGLYAKLWFLLHCKIKLGMQPKEEVWKTRQINEDTALASL